jgi:hypothetical protein
MSDDDGVDGGPVGLTGSIYMRKAEFAGSPTLQARAGSGNLERSTIDAPHLELSKAAFSLEKCDLATRSSGEKQLRNRFIRTRYSRSS